MCAHLHNHDGQWLILSVQTCEADATAARVLADGEGPATDLASPAGLTPLIPAPQEEPSCKVIPASKQTANLLAMNALHAYCLCAHT